MPTEKNIKNNEINIKNLEIEKERYYKQRQTPIYCSNCNRHINYCTCQHFIGR